MKTVRFLFNDGMARAIVQGRKTVTRRPVMPHDIFDDFKTLPPLGIKAPCAPGDILIGRECWRLECTVGAGTEWAISYRATGTTRNFSTYNDPEMGERCTGATIRSSWLWRPSTHMPDWAARIRRRVVSVTVERLQDITETDAVREGFSVGEEYEVFGASTRFCAVWNSVYAAKGLGWDSNCWVWRIEFEHENVQETADARVGGGAA